jgi:hypothetical protein
LVITGFVGGSEDLGDCYEVGVEVPYPTIDVVVHDSPNGPCNQATVGLAVANIGEEPRMDSWMESEHCASVLGFAVTGGVPMSGGPVPNKLVVFLQAGALPTEIPYAIEITRVP